MKELAFNQDRCCHLALCLWLILFHYDHNHVYSTGHSGYDRKLHVYSSGYRTS
jgi:hypothetical protein